MADLYLFNEDERTKANNIINQLEDVLQAAGYSLLDKKKLPPTEEEVIALFSSADISEKSRTDLTEGFSFLSKKLESNFFYITYHFEEIELEPTEEDRKRFSEAFLKGAKKYLHAVEWQYFTNNSSRIAGVRVAEPIKEDNPAFSLLKWESFKKMNVEDETLQQIRKALNLEDHFFIYAPDYLKVSIVCSLLTCFSEIEAENKQKDNSAENIGVLLQGQPKKAYRPNNKLFNNLNKIIESSKGIKTLEEFGEEFGEEFNSSSEFGTDIKVLSRPNVTVQAMAVFADMNGKIISGEYLPEDDMIHNAIFSLYKYSVDEYNNPLPFVTASQVWRAAVHLSGQEKVKESSLDEVKRIVLKLSRSLYIAFDATDEIRARTKDDTEEFRVESTTFLKVDVAKRKVGGKWVDGFIVYPPAMWLYANKNKQLVSLSVDYFNVPNSKTGKIYTKNKHRTLILNYLWKRIDAMKEDQKKKNPDMSDIILFRTLFNETGITGNTQANSKGFIFDALTYWKAKGYIAGFEMQKNIRIIL